MGPHSEFPQALQKPERAERPDGIGNRTQRVALEVNTQPDPMAQRDHGRDGCDERELANLFRAHDAARGLSDEQFASLLGFMEASFEMAVAFAAASAGSNKKAG